MVDVPGLYVLVQFVYGVKQAVCVLCAYEGEFFAWIGYAILAGKIFSMLKLEFASFWPVALVDPFAAQFVALVVGEGVLVDYTSWSGFDVAFIEYVGEDSEGSVPNRRRRMHAPIAKV